ncbi:unnamed protein product [Ascophyllum nodosum]
MTQGYRPGGLVGHVARYQENRLGAQDRSSLFLIVPAPSETCWFRGMSVGGSFRRV